MSFFKNFKKNKLNKSGFSLAEIIVAGAIVVSTITFVAVSLKFYISFSATNSKKTISANLLEEGGEVLLYLRDKGWTENISNLSLDTNYYVYWNGSDYLTTTTTTEIRDSFYLTLYFEEVLRNGSDAISISGSTDDNTRLVTITSSNENSEVNDYTAQALIHNSYEE